MAHNRLADIIDSDGDLPTWAWPGGYPMFYVDKECSTLCPDCANKSYHDPDEHEQFRPIDYGINHEDPDMYCAQCGERIESAYAEDN